jgi:hypothetical protein
MKHHLHVRLRRLFVPLLKWAAFLLLLVSIGIARLYMLDMPPSGAPMGESIDPDEQFYASEIVSGAIQLSSDNRAALLRASTSPGSVEPGAKAPGFSTNTYRRDVHSKTHGCLAARFKVGNVSDDLKFGLFREPGEYSAWIRYSNGTPPVQPDSAKDARGMAIKVMGVEGKKLLDGEEDAKTQDFIMINNPVFFIRTIEEYAAFSSALANGRPLAYLTGADVLWNPLSWHPSKAHLRELMLANNTQSKAPNSVLNERYYSLSAYALGPRRYVKYSARPCQLRPAFEPDRSDPDFLRKGMQQELNKAGACFEFMVQPQVAGKNMPVEDATVEWSEKDSPFIPVARIEIDRQQFDTAERNRFCENLSYNPWHALPEHRPVGVMNRIRKVLYQAISRYRRCKNESSYLLEPEAPPKLTFHCKPCETVDSPANAPDGESIPGGCLFKPKQEQLPKISRSY